MLAATVAIPVHECKAQAQAKEATLQDAIKARTETTVLMEEVAEMDPDLRRLMRKVIAKAEGQQMAGDILLTKDHYGEAVDAFAEAVRIYRQALDGSKLLEGLVAAERKMARSRMLAELSATPKQMRDVRKLEINAEGYMQAAEFEHAIAELAKAGKAYDALLAKLKPATLEEAVAARTAMLSARGQVRDWTKFTGRKEDRLRRLLAAAASKGGSEKGPKPPKLKPGSLPDVLQRAAETERAAADALEERAYPPARALFDKARSLYREASAVQAKRDKVVAAKQSAQESMKLADDAFKWPARSASFERGKQALADADKALAAEDLDKASQMFGQSVEFFAKAHAEAEQLNELGKVQEVWSAAVAGADEKLLTRHVAKEWDAAKAKAAEAEAKSAAGQTQEAIALFNDAATALKGACASASTKENAAKAVPIITRLEAAVRKRDKFQAEGVFAELEKLIPADPRMAGLRKKVNELPWPKETTVDLADGVNMELVLMRQGKFQMGSDKGDDNEEPVHQVTITKPFYIGKYEVTQEQWQALMGSNPSRFKDSKNPVEQVSWDDCHSFMEKLKDKVAGCKFVLPTEAQWEYACRAGSTTEFCFGDAESGLGEYAWFTGNSGSKTHPAGQKKPNAWGLYDMHGNVWEWCADFKGDYPAESVVDPKGPGTGSSRIQRGGSWSNFPRACRSTDRSAYSPGIRDYILGFRVALDLSGTAL